VRARVPAAGRLGRDASRTALGRVDLIVDPALGSVNASIENRIGAVSG